MGAEAFTIHTGRIGLEAFEKATNNIFYGTPSMKITDGAGEPVKIEDMSSEAQQSEYDKHVLKNPILEILPDLDEELRVIEYTKIYSKNNIVVEKRLMKKIHEKLTDYLYDLDPETVNHLMKLVVLKEWPPDFPPPDESLAVKGIEYCFLILLRIENAEAFDKKCEVMNWKKKQIEHRDRNFHSKEAVRHLSRIHSRRK